MHLFINRTEGCKEPEHRRLTTALGTLKLTALGADVGLDVATRASRDAEVLDGFTGILLAAEQQAVGTGRTALGQLVKGQALTTGLQNAGTGGLGETQSTDLHGGQVKLTLIISDYTNADGNVVLGRGNSQVLGDGAQGHRGAVDLAHAQTLQDNLVEAGAGTAGQEAVELDQEVQVDVVTVRRGALQGLDVVLLDINTLGNVSNLLKRDIILEGGSSRSVMKQDIRTRWIKTG